MVQADRWLWHYHHRVFARLIGSDGCVTVHHEEYYLSTQLAGQKVALVVDAPTAAFDVLAGTAVRQQPLDQERRTRQNASGAFHLPDTRTSPVRRAAAARGDQPGGDGESGTQPPDKRGVSTTWPLLSKTGLREPGPLCALRPGSCPPQLVVPPCSSDSCSPLVLSSMALLL